MENPTRMPPKPDRRPVRSRSRCRISGCLTCEKKGIEKSEVYASWSPTDRKLSDLTGRPIMFASMQSAAAHVSPWNLGGASLFACFQVVC